MDERSWKYCENKMSYKHINPMGQTTLIEANKINF